MSLKSRYYEYQFNPKFLGIFLNSFFLSRKELWNHMKGVSHHIQGKTLDVGCGTMPYRVFFKNCEYTGLEYDTPIARAKDAADAYYTGTTFPFKDLEFDSLICNQVLEHVFSPNEFLKECNRVLKHDGAFILSVPFVWDEHEQPYDFGRYSSFGLAHLCKQHGFKIILQKRLNTGILAITQLIAGYIFKSTQSLPTLFKVVLNSLLCGPIFISGIFLQVVLPKNDDLFLDNFLVLKKLQSSQ